MTGLAPFLLCVDFGSTFTKVALVETGRGLLLATAQHRTTVGTDVLDGFASCRAEIAVTHPAAADAPVVACSSAGGGLRIAVVGNEELVTAEAGRRVALSSGGKVVAVLAGGLDEDRLTALTDAAPDVVLLAGGTDGGNAETLLHDAAALVAVGWTRPVVVAGDRDSADQVAAILTSGTIPYVVAANVVPRIGVLAPDEARRAMREVFLEHVIGGKELSTGPEFAAMVLGPTPDVVLLGVEVLAAAHGGTAPGTGVLVVDVGGATTDVHSVLVPDPEENGLAREVVASSPVTRTVEGDLGMRWSAASTATAAQVSGLDLGLDPRTLSDGAARRTEDPGLLAADDTERAVDEALARIAVRVAVRRHAGRSRVVLGPDGRVVERSGQDVRAVDLLVGSGGVLRSAPPEVAEGILAVAAGPDPDGWQVPESPVILIDGTSVLAAAGLLVLYGERVGRPEEASEVARRLVCTSVIDKAHGRSRS